jgi:hypothetical protein
MRAVCGHKEHICGQIPKIQYNKDSKKSEYKVLCQETDRVVKRWELNTIKFIL